MCDIGNNSLNPLFRNNRKSKKPKVISDLLDSPVSSILNNIEDEDSTNFGMVGSSEFPDYGIDDDSD